MKKDAVAFTPISSEPPCFEWHYIMSKTLSEFPLQQRELLFAFRNKYGQRCIVRVEEWSNDLFALKYHLKNQTLSDFRYNLVSGDDWTNARKVINTCINIMVTVHHYFPLHSFCFIGSPRKDKDRNEDINNTQRFRIYTRVISNYFSTKNFIPKEDFRTSSYLMINRQATLQDSTLEDRYAQMYETHIAELID